MTLSRFVGRGHGGGRKRTDWTSEMDAAIRAGVLAGDYAAEVAVRLGKTRNQVIGRAWRMRPRPIWAHLADNQHTEGKPAQERKRTVRLGKSAREVKRGAAKRALAAVAAPIPVPVPVPDDAPPSKDIDIYDLPENACRYPYGERVRYRFCGHEQRPGSSWCPYHERLCVNKRSAAPSW